MRTSLFTGLYRDDSLATCAKAAARIGYDALEIRAVSHLPPDATRAQLDAVGDTVRRAGLAVAALYTPYGRYTEATDDDERRKQVDLARQYAQWAEELDCRLVGHFPGGPAPSEASNADLDTAARWMAAAADAVSDFGVTLVMEMHHRGLTETVDSTLQLLERIDRPNVGVTYDPSNMAIAKDPYGATAIERLGDKIVHVHVKDLTIASALSESSGNWAGPYKGVRWAHALLDEGSVDHKPLVATLAARGYEGYLSCESDVAGAPDAIAEHEFKVLSSMLAEARRSTVDGVAGRPRTESR